MVFVVVAFLWRIPSIDRAAFRFHYETIHMPLLLKLLRSAFPVTHTRHYVSLGDISSATGAEDSGKTQEYVTKMSTHVQESFDYDCWSEMVFRDKQHFAEFYQRFTSEKVSKHVRQDELNFVLVEKLRSVSIDEPVVTTGPVVWFEFTPRTFTARFYTRRSDTSGEAQRVQNQRRVLLGGCGGI